MLATALEPGQVLGGRFAVVGLLGSGGTASVFLVVDQLKGERVALKVVHPHLLADPAAQRRIRKEIAAASLLDSDRVLVPDELHELDGLLCLTLPYHAGQTLTEHVASQGPLDVDGVRDLGIRVAGALEQAHRRGLLHRDVTANNVMLSGGRDALLMDFGLSRTETSSTRSTGILGTAGFAAPEVYAGERADPRTDLYGLGCLLYLAATGSLPFGSDNAMGTLQRQLAEGFTPVRDLRPELPAELASTIESMLRRDRADRPTSAGEVVAALTAKTGLSSEVVPEGDRLLHLPPGPCSVRVQERSEDIGRRRVLRVDQGKARKTVESEITKRAQQLWTGVLAYVGVQDEETVSPEQLLVRAVADEAHVDAGWLRQSPALLQTRFVLVEGVSRDAARRIASDARSAGFQAQIHTGEAPRIHPLILLFLGLVITLSLPLLLVVPPAGVVLLAIGLVCTLGLIVAQRVAALQEADLPVAYAASLDSWLKKPVAGRYGAEDAPSRTSSPEATSAPARPGGVAERARAALDALERTVKAADLPEIVASDLRATVRDLRARADELADDLVGLERELAEPVEDTSWVEPRLARLTTKQRAGEPVDPAELLRLRGLLRQAEASASLTAQLQSHCTAATAGLLEIAASAATARRKLLSEPNASTGATQALDRLHLEADAARRARAELGRRLKA